MLTCREREGEKVQGTKCSTYGPIPQVARHTFIYPWELPPSRPLNNLSITFSTPPLP